SQPGNWPSRIAMALLLGLYCWITRRIGNREREWTVFVCGAAVVFTPWILGLQHGFRVVGEPHRLLPEFDLVMILVVIEVVRHLWSGGPKARSTKLARAVAVAIVVVGFAPAIRYVGHAWTPFPKAGPLEGQYDYRITRWIHDHLPGQRVLPPGTVRFWFDAWFDNAQPDGGSMQGMLNQIIPIGTWQILHGDDAHIATLWLQALGTDAVVVPDPSSPEPYRDYSNPQKFRGVLPVLYDDGRGTVIYRVPRAQPGAARVVDASRLPGPIRGGDDRDRLTNYVAAIETPQAAAVNWRGFDEASIDTTTGAGQSVLVQQTFDPAWRARENGRTLPIRREPVMGFMLIDAPSGPHRIDLRFETPLENRIGQILFLLTLAAIMAMLVK
ncbi:MAG TPA: hypothetical protein VFA04_01860, partial [Bryobacteraceae bacterium]|nr:hypothetical protein [Bryobacteraceae bacterium]